MDANEESKGTTEEHNDNNEDSLSEENNHTKSDFNKQTLNDTNEEIKQECRLFKNVNKSLVPPKLFYFFFFAANGTLLPYLILFFKQIGLSPSQVGIVVGFKPFISFVFSPIWGYIADKTKKTRIIFVISLLAYVSGYFAYSFAPTKHVCTVRSNLTKHADMPIIQSHIHKRRYFTANSDLNVGIYDQGIKNQESINIRSNQRLDKSHKVKRNVIAHLDSYYRKKPAFSNVKSGTHMSAEQVNANKRSEDTERKLTNKRIPYETYFPAELSSSLFQIPVTSINFISLKSPPQPKKVISKTTKKYELENQSEMKPMIIDSEIQKSTNLELSVPLSLEKSWTKAVDTNKGPWAVCAAAKANTVEEIFFSETLRGAVNLQAIFTYLLVVTIAATLFSCPLITIVDTATIRKLKENNETHKYGKQRLWGSLGWGLASFGVGTIISTIPLCPGINKEVNYYPAFYVFASLLLIALVIGLKLQFSDDINEDVNEECSTVAARAEKIKNGLKLLKEPIYLSFILTSFYIGITMSIIKTFLFWHLKDLGGTQLLFSIISGVNCVAEVFVYFFSSTFIKQIGHIRVLYTALVCYSLRLFYYGLLTNPWYVLAAEPLSGITTAAAWASMTSFVGLNANLESVTTLQGILHGVHWGLGHGCGELLGGFMVTWIGAAMTFNVFGFVTILQLFLFVFINRLASKVVDSNGEENSGLRDTMDE